MREDFLPGNEAQLVTWFANFNGKFATFAATLGLSAEVSGVQNDNAMVQYLIPQYKMGFENSRSMVTGFANGMLNGGIAAPGAIAPFPLAPAFGGAMVEPGIIGRARNLAGRIKRAPGYTEEMGRSLGIVAPEAPDDLTAPALEITALAGRVLEIKWRKGGASGLEVYVDAGAGFPEEGRVLTESEGKITVRGVAGTGPVEAKVKGIYQKKGEEVGEFGPEYSVILLT